MREEVVKKICIFLTILLAIFLVVMGFQYREKEKKNTQQLQEADRKIFFLEEEKIALQQELEKVEEEYDKKLKGKTCVILSFERMDSELYTTVYPLFRRYDMEGVFVMKEGKIPGDEGVMTREEYEIMVENGWEAAMGGSSEVSLLDAGEEQVSKWQQYVVNYIQALENAGIDRPKTYCFEQGEYKEEYESFLKEQGFKIIRHYGENEIPVATSELTKPILRVGSTRFQVLNTEVESTLLSVMYSSDSIAISTQYPEVEELTNLLLLLVDVRENDSVKIKTFEGFRTYKKKVEDDLEKNTKKKEKEMQAVQEEIEERDNQIQELMEKQSTN